MVDLEDLPYEWDQALKLFIGRLPEIPEFSDYVKAAEGVYRMAGGAEAACKLIDFPYPCFPSEYNHYLSASFPYLLIPGDHRSQLLFWALSQAYLTYECTGLSKLRFPPRLQSLAEYSLANGNPATHEWIMNAFELYGVDDDELRKFLGYDAFDSRICWDQRVSIACGSESGNPCKEQLRLILLEYGEERLGASPEPPEIRMKQKKQERRRQRIEKAAGIAAGIAGAAVMTAAVASETGKAGRAGMAGMAAGVLDKDGMDKSTAKAIPTEPEGDLETTDKKEPAKIGEKEEVSFAQILADARRLAGDPHFRSRWDYELTSYGRIAYTGKTYLNKSYGIQRTTELMALLLSFGPYCTSSWQGLEFYYEPSYLLEGIDVHENTSNARHRFLQKCKTHDWAKELAVTETLREMRKNFDLDDDEIATFFKTNPHAYKSNIDYLIVNNSCLKYYSEPWFHF